MSSKIILLSELEAIKNIPELSFHDNDKICVIPVCCRSPYVIDSSSFNSFFGPNGEKGERLRKTLFSVGVKEENLFFVNYYDPDISTNRSIIHNAQYIFLTGGLMELGVERMKKTGLDMVLKEYSGVIICYSAGGIMLFDKYIIIPNLVYKNMEIANGLGLIDSNKFVIDVHFDDSNTEQISLLTKASKVFNKNIYAISQAGYIIISDNKIIDLYKTRLFQR